MDIVFNSCCGHMPEAIHGEGNWVYIQCPMCKRESGRMPLIERGLVDRDAAIECAKRWNEGSAQAGDYRMA